MEPFNPNAQSNTGAENRAKVVFNAYNDVSTTFVGTSIANLRRLLAEKWGIPAGTTAFRGRDALNDNYVVQPGDVIEFQKRLGEKG